jgi:hypothetical protein
MNMKPSPWLAGVALIVLLAFGRLGMADPNQGPQAEPEQNTPQAAPAAGAQPQASPAQPARPSHEQVLKDLQLIDGLLPMYHKGSKLFAELTPAHLNKDYIVLISIARGIGQGQLLGGMSWGFGDDWIWQFRKADDRILIVRRNVRFRADAGSPEANAVKLAYTDSVLFALPIITQGPRGGDVVDLAQVFMSDLPQISRVLPGFAIAPPKSLFASIKGFRDNVELQVAATYQSGGGADLDTVADARGATINVHYSISQLPNTGYKPRLADPRVGYFVTAVKDFSTKSEEERFVRYINRWDLQKADPNAELSPPKRPIVFWIEKTVPFKYRKPIREGIEEWNKAFEKAGFVNAIEVRQQPDDATWDPEDVNFNTYRWITASAGFAMGPSRVNPMTGQILDADIIFDADFLQYWKQEFETFTPEAIEALTGGSLDPAAWRDSHGDLLGLACRCSSHQGFSRELAFGASVLAARPNTEAEVEKMIMQGLKEIAMHEVGHTLGLRHNFKASTLYSLDDANNPEKTRNTGLAASVMDYLPTNLVPKGVEQGDYYSQTIGPYDVWAIEFGYKPLPGGSPEGETPHLQKIAARSGEPGHAFLTDEDTRAIDPDPMSNRFDLGDCSITFAKRQSQLISELWPGLVERVTKEGEGYEKARRAFNVLLSRYGTAMYMAARNVGGVSVSRSHRGDPNASPPLAVVSAEKQREAMQLLETNVFSDQPFQFPPELYTHLAASRWLHWGNRLPDRTDFPAHQVVLLWQERTLSLLLSPVTLERLHDSELKVPADQDAFTTAELIQRLTRVIFSELDNMNEGEYTNRKPAISSMRRNLQRSYLGRLSSLAMSNTGAPYDCQTVAFVELRDLKNRIDAAVAKPNVKYDAYCQAHLQESSARIAKVLEAGLMLSRP